MVALMKNGIITPRLFALLDSIREKHHVTDVAWAQAAEKVQKKKFYKERLSEYRKMAHDREAKVGRAFTPEKFITLLGALKTILGEELVNKEMQTLIEKTSDTETKCHLALTTFDTSQLEQVWLYLKALAGMNT